MTDTTTIERTYDLSSLSVDKRVHYVFGQVLGVDDFRTEQKYHIDVDRRQNRALHGYGTVWGLAVTVKLDDGQPQIYVSPGLAVDPAGREIEVPTEQCADLNKWLQSKLEGLSEKQYEKLYVDGGGTAWAYITLCHDLCFSDKHPTAGEPCRHEDDAIQATRVQDDYRLQLVNTPPAQNEEDMVRAFGRLLGFFEIGPDDEIDQELDIGALLEHLKYVVDTINMLSDEALRDEMRSIAGLSSDAISDMLPEFTEASHFDEPDRIAYFRDFAEANGKDLISLTREQSRWLFRTLFRYWVTHKRATALSDDACILLAAIQFKLDENGVVLADSMPFADDSDRPYLLHTRMLQEWLISGHGPKGERGDRGLRGYRGRQGEDGAGLKQAIINPNMMMPSAEESVGGESGGEQCLDFDQFADNESFGNPFDLDGFKFTGLGDGEPFVNIISDDVKGLQLQDDGIQIELSTSASIVTMQIGSWNDRLTITAQDSDGNEVAQTSVSADNALHPVTFSEEDIKTIVITGGGGEGVIAEICVTTPGTGQGISTPKLAMLNNIYPAWPLKPPGDALTFTWGRPQTVPLDVEHSMALRLYWTPAALRDAEAVVVWRVYWRWVTAILPGHGTNAPLTELGDLLPAEITGEPADLPGAQQSIAPLVEENFHLNVTDPFLLKSSDDNQVGDYLIVRINAEHVEGAEHAHLLMAELSWEEAG